MPRSPRIVIIGAGLAGSLLACLLAREGFNVDVFERRPDPRVRGYAGGRSINLALSARGIAALRRAGLAERVLKHDAIPMRGRMLHLPAAPGEKTPVAFQPYSANPADAINSVSRGGLNISLLHAAAEHAGVRMHFDHCHLDGGGIADAGRAVFAHVHDGGLPTPASPRIEVEADLILGADGAFSSVRSMLMRQDRFEYEQKFLSHGYKELHIPPRADVAGAGAGGAGAGALGDGGVREERFALDPNALHIWPRGGAMMIALPNMDGSFTCTLFWPRDGGESDHALTALRTGRQVREFFERHYPDAVPMMPTLEEDYLRNPIGSLVTVRCAPWFAGGGASGGYAAVLGDAAHAIVPFYGQGMNCAFEDCVALVDALRAHGADARKGTLGDLGAALAAFQAERKPNAEAIADMALENFIEMRDKVGSPAFLYRKKVEQTLHKLLPERCEPQYHLVSFSTVPYAESRRRGRELDTLYDRVIAQLPHGSVQSLGETAWTERVRRIGEEWIAGVGATATTRGSRAGDNRPVIDISPPITPQIKVWPGDSPMTREVLCDLDRGDNITLSTLRSTVHLGSHADGPNHYAKGGRCVGSQDLSHYIGPCHVLAATMPEPRPGGERVSVAAVGGAAALAGIVHPRVLIRTGTYTDSTIWHDRFAGLSVELIDALAARGVRTIGIDTPSVDLFSSKDLPAHQAIARYDIAIIEGLVLAHVPPGEFELLAQPLRLIGFDASPVRALLRPLQP